MSKDLLPKVEEAIRRHSMLNAGDGVVVACSGGPDSLTLLGVLSALRAVYDLKITAVYIDHGLRPEAPQEGTFVVKQAAAWGIEAEVHQINVDLHTGSGSLQSRARTERYRILREVAEQRGACRIALGHTADDQAETLVMRFLRGTGSQGLAGIPPVNGPLIRPLLYVWREETEAYCREHQLIPVRDPSNEKDDYLRNQVRHHVVPAMLAYNGQFKESLLRLADSASVENEWLESAVTDFLAEYAVATDDGWWCPLGAFQAVHLALQRRILRALARRARSSQGLDAQELSFEHTASALELIQQGRTGAHLPLPEDTVIWSERGGFWVGPAKSSQPFHISMSVPGETLLPGTGDMRLITRLTEGSGRMLSEVQQHMPQLVGPWHPGGYRAKLDWGAVQGPLFARCRQLGDRIQLLGMQEEKKLQDIFVDVGVPRRWRDRVPLVADSRGILWAPGLRPAERAKVTKSSSIVLEIECVP